jgi:hypothetical protein
LAPFDFAKIRVFFYYNINFSKKQIKLLKKEKKYAIILKYPFGKGDFLWLHPLGA